MTDYQRTTTTFVQGSRTLPRECYTSPELLEGEREKIFAREWNCVGRASRVTQKGQFFTREIAGDSLIVLRDRNGDLKAFFNICRHRGTRMCGEESGRF